MFEPLLIIFERLPIFALVMFRVAGITLLCPLFGMKSLTGKFRVMLVFVLALAVFPLAPRSVYVPNSYIGLALGVGAELIIGLSMGFILRLFLVGVQMGAKMISQQMGFAMSRMVDPSTGINTTLMSQFYIMLVTILYVLMNGHLILVQSVADTFRILPLMATHDNERLISIFSSLMIAAYQLGIRLAGPILVAVFLVTLALGFISRTMPQLNILAAGFPIRIMLCFTMIIASLGMIFMLFEDGLQQVFRDIGMLFIY